LIASTAQAALVRSAIRLLHPTALIHRRHASEGFGAIIDQLCIHGATEGREASMNEETLNLSIRKFLKVVGISSQREIEKAVAKAMDDGLIKGGESFPASMTLEVAGLKLQARFDGEIALE
jgi:hypothetical protein